MRRTIKLAVVTALMLALASVAALAANLVGNNLPNVINGTAANDTINGRGGGDRLSGFGGLDEIVGGAGDDLILGGGSADNLRDGNGSDRILGGPGHDTVYLVGDDFTDYVDCGAGFDHVMRPEVALPKDRLVNCEAVF